MEFKNVLVLLIVSLLLFGTVCAQKTVNDFEIDEAYEGAYNGSYHSLYLNGNQDSGVAIYKYVVGGIDEDDDSHDNIIHDDGRDYLTSDDDMKVEKNSDNTFNFTDYDHAIHGVGEVMENDGNSFIVVFLAKDTSDVNNTYLNSQLNEFNDDNNVSVVAF